MNARQMVHHSKTLVLLVAVFLSGVSVCAEAADTFSIPLNISNTVQDSTDHQVATSGANVFVAWNDNLIGSNVFNPEIYFMRSTDGGRTFGAAVNLSNSPTVSASPRLAATGQDVYVTWQEAGGDFFVHSGDSGLSFEAPVNLTSTFGMQIGASASLAASGANLYVVCQKSSGVNDDIFVLRSLDKGLSFGPAQNISNTAAFSSKPRIAASGASVYVAWVESVSSPVSGSDIYFVSSSDSGLGYAAPKNLSNTNGISTAVTLSADGLNVWMAWSDRVTGNDEISFVHSTDSGANFGVILNLSNNTSKSTDPSVVGKGNRVYLTWSDIPQGDTKSDIFLVSSTDAGITFEVAQNISNSVGVNSGQAKLALASTAISVCWLEGIFRDIFSAYSETSVPIPAPTLTGVSPASGQRGQTLDVVVAGTDFQEGAALQILGEGVTVVSSHLNSPTEFAATLSVTIHAPLGAHDLELTNLDSQSTTLPGSFVVTSASALALIETTRTDLNQGVLTGGFLMGNQSYKSLLAHLSNAESALKLSIPDTLKATAEVDSFYIKIVNMAKGKKPDLSKELFKTLYADYSELIASLGGVPKPAN